MSIKVLVIDDPAPRGGSLADALRSVPALKVVGTTCETDAALEWIKSEHPRVLVVNSGMQTPGGVRLLEVLKRFRSIPVVLIPSTREYHQGERLLERIQEALTNRPVVDPSSFVVDKALTADAILPLGPARVPPGGDRLILIGSSTGGTEAVKDVLSGMPPDAPGILVTQHMPESFTSTFAQRLDALCQIRVKEAQAGEPVLPGHAYIAPGHSHLLVQVEGTRYVVELSNGPPVNRHRPSVDVLFRSAAVRVGRNAVGVILTGMGKDGARGMLEMKHAGAYNIAQNEASCVVFGMPKEAIQAGGVDEIVALPDIARRLTDHLGRTGYRSR